MATPDQPHGSPEDIAKASKPAKVQSGIDTREKHGQVIHILKDPQFGLAELLKGKETLSPQEAASIWSGENLQMLQGFPVEGTPEQKQAYLAEHSDFQNLIEQTRQILSTKAQSTGKANGEDNADLDAALTEELESATGPGKLEKADLTESPETRKARISEFVTGNFPECPPEHLDAATGACTSYENENRELFEDPTFKVSKEDVGDLKPEIDKVIKIENNKKVIAEATKKKNTAEAVIVREEAGDRQDKVKIKVEDGKTPKLERQVGQAKEEAENAETEADEREDTADQVKKDQETIEKKYPALLKKGQVAALQELIGMVKSPEVKQRLQGIISTIGRLKNVVPGKQAQLDQIFNSTPLNLSSGSVTGAFSTFLPKLHASQHFTEEEKHAIHAALHHSPKTSMDAQAALRQGRGYQTDPETGEKIPLKYDKDHPLHLEGGGEMYEETNGSVIVQVGEWKKEIDGAILPSDLTRWVSFGKDQQDFQTAGVENFMGYRFGIHEPDKYLKKFQHIKNSLLGGARGLEGTYASHNDSHRYMHTVKFLSSFGENSVKVNENTMAKSMKGLGLTPKGILEADSAVLKEIGAFFQQTPTAHGEEAYAALQKRLIDKGLFDPIIAHAE